MFRFIGRAFVRLLRVFALLGLLALLAGAAGFWWLERNILSTLPKDLSEFRTYRPPTSCRVFDAKGREVDQFYLERRIWVPLSELPPVVGQAFVSSEDRRFFDHPGVDLIGITRALVSNLVAGHTVQGGSTLTQQLVKNLLVGRERSYKRKLSEAVLSWRLEKELSKEEILELYLNYVFLGSGNYGVEAAARDYFGVSARALGPAQAATLAGLVPAPSRYSPRLNPQLAQERRDLVLRSMVRDGVLDEAQLQALRAEPIASPREARAGASSVTAYITQVRREIRRVAGAEVPFREGLQVHTPLDTEVQGAAHAAIREALTELESRQGRRGAVRRIDPSEWDAFRKRAAGLDRNAKGEPKRPEPGQCFSALVGPDRSLAALWSGPFELPLRESDRLQRVRDLEGRAPQPLATRVRAGDVLRVCMGEDGQLGLDPRPWGEGAAVVLENDTGRVVALVGGYDVGLEGFVRATQARRQPGSSFKPYVYAAKLLRGGSQLDPVLDAPLALPAGGGKIWSPKNYTGTFSGFVPMRQAMSQSLNTVAVRMTLEVGPEEVARVAQTMGVRSPLRPDPTLALGSAEVTPLDQALGFATLARMGMSVEPVYIDRVENADGAPMGERGGPLHADGELIAQLPGRPGERVLPPEVAYQVLDMLREVVRAGTARRANRPGFDRMGKTGTTNGYQDAWFVGSTPKHTVAVWIGTDGKFPLGDKESGGRAALPAWMKIVEALGEIEGERFPVPDEVVLVPSNGQWVGVGRGRVSQTVLGAGPLGSAPLPAF